MRRFLFLAMLAASLLPRSGPAQAQVTADQLNKLSLEALTARPAGGYTGRSAYPDYRPAYRTRSYGRSSYAHGRRYAVPSRRYARPAPYQRPSGSRGGRAGGHVAPPVYRHGAPAYHRPSHR